MAQQNVKPNGYRPRIVDKQIERYMRIFGAVEIAGTKWCGKTWAARAHANSITYVDRDNNLPMAQADPSLMLLGDRPHVSGVGGPSMRGQEGGQAEQPEQQA